SDSRSSTTGRAARGKLFRYAVKSRVVYPLVLPPLPSITSSNTPGPYFLPPLNIMCSKRCAIPVAPPCSLLDPARKKTYDEMTGEEWSACTSSRRPFASVNYASGHVTTATPHSSPHP